MLIWVADLLCVMLPPTDTTHRVPYTIEKKTTLIEPSSRFAKIILSFENCWKLLRISRDYRETEHAISQRKSIWRIWFQPFTPPSLLPYCKKSQGAPKNNYRKLLQARVRARSSSRSALTENHISILYVVSYCLQNTTLWILGTWRGRGRF